MKKKIKDLTKKQRNKICSKYFTQHDCINCPLSPFVKEGRGIKVKFSCNKNVIKEWNNYLNKEVEVDE